MSPTNGGSNANDFQPTTRNPQDIPSNLFQQQGGVQSVTNTQELLNDQQNATISITRAPAQAAPQAATASETPIGFIVLLAVIAAVLIALYRRQMQNTTRQAETESNEVAQNDVQVSEAATDKEPAAAEKKSHKPKKKTPKKSKPRRR